MVLFGMLFLGVSDTQLIPPLLSLIAEELNIPPGRAGTIVTIYALAAAAFGLVLGTASDRFGRKRLMCLALAIFVVASLLTYRSSYFSILLTARFLTGLSAGTLSTLGLAYAGDHYPYEQRGKAMGIISMAYFLAFAIGIPAGTIVAARLGWRLVFLGLSAAGAAMLLVAVGLLPPDRRKSGQATRVWLLTHFQFRDRSAGIATAFLTSGGIVGFLTFVGVWLADQNIGVERIGLLFMIAGLCAASASPISGWAADRIGKKKIVIGANLILAPMFVVVSGIEWGWPLFLAVGLLSVTASARQAPLHALTTELVGAEARGSYVAVRNAASQLGIAAAATVSAFAFDQVGFAAVAWIAAGVTILIVPVCGWIKEPAS